MTTLIIMLGVAFTVAPFIPSSRDEDIYLYEGISLLCLSFLVIAVHFILKDIALTRVLDVLESVNLFIFTVLLLKRNKKAYLVSSLAAVTILLAAII